MATVPGQLIWEIVKKNNSFLVKEFGNGTASVKFTKEPNNLFNLHSYKHSGLANKKTVTIQPNGKEHSVVIATSKTKKQNKPASLLNKSVMKKEFHRMTKAVSNQCIVNEKPAYVSIKINDKKVAETTHEQGRVWNQTFQILCAHPLDTTTIILTLKTRASILGKIIIQAHQLLNGCSLINGFFPMSMENGKLKRNLKLQYILWFKPAEYEPTWDQIILSNDHLNGMKHTTFPQRSNCIVSFYQDAHHNHDFQQLMNLRNPPKKLWEDIYKAFDGAKHLIYIAGWSLNPNIVLVRDKNTAIPNAHGVKLGDLLKRKAEQGVGVRLLLWHDETSLPIIKNEGMMRTNGEETFAYFKHTKVICKLCPRLHDDFPTVFSHHQKTISVDTHTTDLSSSNREIMSFIGGFDLCDGRYDTEEHSLFQTLNTESHCFDFYQTCISGAGIHKGGPREPWHDTHACIVGQAAWDVLTNFEQRWTKQCDPSKLVHISSIQELANGQFNPSSMSMDRNWRVQVFRSIDHVSASSLPEKMTVEQSIHQAYVEAIRRADSFIYIENQYFIGGCYLWEKDRNCGCTNLIPVELALKVASKIKAKERFTAYIVLPMWPEGVPESESVHDILHWTRETMKMMYHIVGDALTECGDELGHPRDYLNFFCLGNRERETQREFISPYSPHQGTHYSNAQQHRRFMVYVHSKLMIVDDTYLLIGSANVNQRSMDGHRDTEIAIGCYQSMQEEENTNRGDIQAFRMSLWYEHTGKVESVFKDPQTLECVQNICSTGQELWDVYNGDEVIDMKGHLMNFPMRVTNKGCVEDLLENDGNFPDTWTPVKGKRSKVLAPLLTT